MRKVEKGVGRKFTVGKSYRAYGFGIDPITVVRRTAQYVTVSNGYSEWRMKVRHNEQGNEILADSTVPAKWYSEFVYSAGLEVEE